MCSHGETLHESGWLADGVKRSNMGLGGFLLEANASIREGAILLEETHERISLLKPAPDAGPGWRRIEIREWTADPPKGELAR